ncbi:MAG TPA: NADH-quinone oxidoreductase subunit A [Cytophagales bacterium]|nr:NADH-quinone oxidoreductase subunit A [Cytophagales bacterium]
MLSQFGIVLVFICTVVVFLLATFLLSRMLRTQRPNPVKLSTYESGEESLGALNSTFNPKYYVIAIAFLLFEVEVILLFPWALVYADRHILAMETKSWYWMAMAELGFFVLLLALGLAYVWKKGHFDWGHPVKRVQHEIPQVYQDFNARHTSK